METMIIVDIDSTRIAQDGPELLDFDKATGYVLKTFVPYFFNINQEYICHLLIGNAIIKMPRLGLL